MNENEEFQKLKIDILKLEEKQKNDFVYSLMGSLGYYFDYKDMNIDKSSVLQSLQLALKNSSNRP